MDNDKELVLNQEMILDECASKLAECFSGVLILTSDEKNIWHRVRGDAAAHIGLAKSYLRRQNNLELSEMLRENS